MSSSNQKHLDIFAKFSVLCIMLPYYGKCKKWRELLTGLCKQSADTWKTYESAFQNLFEMTAWDWTEELTTLLRRHDIDKKPVLSRGYCLNLDLFKCSKPISDFIHKAKDMEFKPLRKLSMNWVYKLGEESLGHTNLFFQSCFPSLDVLYLQGCNRMSLNKLSSGLAALLPKIHSQVYIHNFKIDEQTLKRVVFGSSTSCKELVLRY